MWHQTKRAETGVTNEPLTDCVRVDVLGAKVNSSSKVGMCTANCVVIACIYFVDIHGCDMLGSSIIRGFASSY